MFLKGLENCETLEELDLSKNVITKTDGEISFNGIVNLYDIY